MFKNKKVRASAGLAALAISSITLLAAPNAANAAISPTCDAAIFTGTLTDSATGAPLANGVYTVKTSGDVYLKTGSHMDQQDDFRAAFDGPDSTLGKSDAQLIATYFAPVDQDTLGTTPVAYPDDPSGFTDPVAQKLAIQKLLASQKWADFSADVKRRAAAFDAVRNNSAVWNQIENGSDPAYKASFDDAYTKIGNIEGWVVGLEDDPDGTNYDSDVALYQWAVDPANWSFGVSVTPDEQLLYRVAGATGQDVDAAASAANAEAATAVGATQEVSVTTDASGQFQVTVFGVKGGTGVAGAVFTNGTRGDTTCSQLTSTLAETTQPVGYHTNFLGQSYTVASDETASGSVTLVNDPITDVDLTQNNDAPVAPVHTSTGI